VASSKKKKAIAVSVEKHAFMYSITSGSPMWDVDIRYDNHIDYNKCSFLAPVFRRAGSVFE
jgi:hypothetical protein